MTIAADGGPSSCVANPENCTNKDLATGLWWSKLHGQLNWQDAIDHCEALSFNGKSDWRLPTVDELRLIAGNKIKPAMQNERMQAEKFDGNLWSASSGSTIPNSAWVVYLGNGFSLTIDKTSSYYLACVR